MIVILNDVNMFGSSCMMPANTALTNLLIRYLCS